MRLLAPSTRSDSVAVQYLRGRKLGSLLKLQKQEKHVLDPMELPKLKVGMGIIHNPTTSSDFPTKHESFAPSEVAYLGERDDESPCIAGCRRRGLLSHLRRADLSGSCDAIRARRAPTAWQEDLPSTVLEGLRMRQDRSLPVACSKKALTFVTSTEPRNCEHNVGSFDVHTFSIIFILYIYKIDICARAPRCCVLENT